MVVNSGNGNAAPTTAEATGSGALRGVGTIGDSGGSGNGGGGGGGGVVVTPQLRHKIEKLALELLKMENEKFSIPALKLLLSCMYVGKYNKEYQTNTTIAIITRRRRGRCTTPTIKKDKQQGQQNSCS